MRGIDELICDLRRYAWQGKIDEDNARQEQAYKNTHPWEWRKVDNREAYIKKRMEYDKIS